MATRRARKRADLILAEEDPFKNIVRLETHTWGHIAGKHQEVADVAEGTLRQLISSPDRIRKSTLDKDVAAFEGGPLRALVLYETTAFTAGESFGRITTVYPLGTGPANVGEIIWSKGSGTNQ